MEFEFFQLEKQNGIAKIFFSRPAGFNALNSSVLREFEVLLEQISTDKEINVLILTSKEKAFVSGADIAEMSNMTKEEAYKFAKLGHRAFTKLEKLPFPTIAAINGFALGGGLEIALACDILIASENAKLGQPEVGLGITPGFGGTQRLRNRAGVAVAKDLILTGRIIKAEEAQKLGILSRVVTLDKLQEESLNIANEIMQKSPNAVSIAKRAINEGMYLNHEESLALEESLFAECFTHQDQKSGMSSFLNKKKPEFKERS